jgi:hypothetical protein
MGGSSLMSGNSLSLLGTASLNTTVTATLKVSTLLGFFTAGLQTQQTVTGSRGGNAALASLLTALATYGLITDSTTA